MRPTRNAMLTLGAVMRDGVPIAEVREGIAENTSDFRVMQWRGFDPGEKRRFSRCSRVPCRVGTPCENHMREAAWWWFEWARRKQLAASAEPE